LPVIGNSAYFTWPWSDLGTDLSAFVTVTMSGRLLRSVSGDWRWFGGFRRVAGNHWHEIFVSNPSIGSYHLLAKFTLNSDGLDCGIEFRMICRNRPVDGYDFYLLIFGDNHTITFASPIEILLSTLLFPFSFYPRFKLFDIDMFDMARAPSAFQYGI
jgi:hypothetical protein